MADTNSKNTDAQRRASAKYLKESVDDIRIRVPKGQKEIIKAHAAANGKSLNGYIYDLICDDMGAILQMQ